MGWLARGLWISAEVVVVGDRRARPQVVLTYDCERDEKGRPRSRSKGMRYKINKFLLALLLTWGGLI
jgi:hypothetical protein